MVNNLVKSDTEVFVHDNTVRYFKNEYNIKLFSVLLQTINSSDWLKFSYLDLWNLATESITKAIIDVKNSWEWNNVWLVPGFPTFLINSNDKSIPNSYEIYKQFLEKMCEWSKRNWQTLILWFSSMWWYELLPKLSEIIKELKSKYNDLIFIIWWADFNVLPEKVFLDKVFDYGIDIVNIWWAFEFVQFFWKIPMEDSFYRDEAWLLRLKTNRDIPQNLIFQYNKDEIWDIIPWSKIETTSYYDELNKRLHFSINNNPCLNTCSYCVKSIQSSIPFKDSDLEKAIEDLNRYISSIKNDGKFSLTLDNPNPMQYIDKFTIFLQRIDLSKIKEISFFWDFMWMWNEKVYNKVIVLIDELLDKRSNLYITVHFWIDALHYKNDWEFVWRAMWNKLASEQRYISWFEKFGSFQDKYRDNKRIYTPFNVIFHPKMELLDYRERIEFIDRYITEAWIWKYALSPNPNTKIETEHSWFFMPIYEWINNQSKLIDFTKDINFWWYFYLNSSFLDCYLFSEYKWLWHLFDWVIDQYIEQILSKENKNLDIDFKKEIFLSFLKWDLQIIQREIKKINSLIWRLKNLKTRKEKLVRLNETVDFSIEYINFMIYRENYIWSINQEYQSDDLDELIKCLIEFREKYSKIKSNIV